MQITAPLVAALFAAGAAAQANQPWNMTSWTGRGCAGGRSGIWRVGPGTNSCITFSNVLSLRVNNQGPCTTVYYRNNACTGGEYFAANPGICNGFDGGIVGSFRVTCDD